MFNQYIDEEDDGQDDGTGGSGGRNSRSTKRPTKRPVVKCHVDGFKITVTVNIFAVFTVKQD